MTNTPKPKDFEAIMAGLENAPLMLQTMLELIPNERRKIRRIKGKWSIYEHAVHITLVQTMIRERVERFLKEAHPVFKPYFPDNEEVETDLLEIDLSQAILHYIKETQRTLELLKQFNPEDLQKHGTHLEYKEYTPYILMRHTLMHFHLHLYRMEEMWLTMDDYLQDDFIPDID